MFFLNLLSNQCVNSAVQLTALTMQTADVLCLGSILGEKGSYFKLFFCFTGSECCIINRAVLGRSSVGCPNFLRLLVDDRYLMTLERTVGQLAGPPCR